MKKNISVKILLTSNVNINIINVYRIIENELNSWRDIYIQLGGC